MDDGVSEEEAIGRVERQATVASLLADLRSLGATAGMTVMVHSSLSGLGYVSGGAQAVVQALLPVTSAIRPSGVISRYRQPGGTRCTRDACVRRPAYPDTGHGCHRGVFPPCPRSTANASALVDGHELAHGWASRHHRLACMTSTVTSCCWASRIRTTRRCISLSTEQRHPTPL